MESGLKFGYGAVVSQRFREWSAFVEEKGDRKAIAEQRCSGRKRQNVFEALGFQRRIYHAIEKLATNPCKLTQGIS